MEKGITYFETKRILIKRMKQIKSIGIKYDESDTPKKHPEWKNIM